MKCILVTIPRGGGGHIIGKSVNDPDKAARTVLAIMIAPFMGGPAFVAKLTPIYSLKADFFYEQIKAIIELIHQNSGYVSCDGR